jgi:hypothetical protein
MRRPGRNGRAPRVDQPSFEQSAFERAGGPAGALLSPSPGCPEGLGDGGEVRLNDKLAENAPVLALAGEDEERNGPEVWIAAQSAEDRRVPDFSIDAEGLPQRCVVGTSVLAIAPGGAGQCAPCPGCPGASGHVIRALGYRMKGGPRDRTQIAGPDTFAAVAPRVRDLRVHT